MILIHLSLQFTVALIPNVLLLVVVSAAVVGQVLHPKS